MIITQRERPAFVVISFDAFQRLNAADTRRRYMIDTLPEDIFEKAVIALDRLEADQ